MNKRIGKQYKCFIKQILNLVHITFGYVDLFILFIYSNVTLHLHLQINDKEWTFKVGEHENNVCFYMYCLREEEFYSFFNVQRFSWRRVHVSLL